jgi:hypothetical protein
VRILICIQIASFPVKLFIFSIVSIITNYLVLMFSRGNFLLIFIGKSKGSSSSFLYRLNPVPYFSALFGCLSFFSFRSFACWIAFCFWPFSLSFLPPLSPIVNLLWCCRSYSCLSRTCVPHNECYQKYGSKARAGVATVRLELTAVGI